MCVSSATHKAASLVTDVCDCFVFSCLLARRCRVCVCAGVMLLEKTGCKNVSGSSSHKVSLVMAFCSSRSLFTALG